jgi:hypothetical protein
LIVLFQDITGNCPNINDSGTVLAQQLSTSAGSGASGENVVNQNDPRIGQRLIPAKCESTLHIFGAFGAGEARLSGRGEHSFEEARVQWNAGGAAEMLRETSGLIESALADFAPVERNGDDKIPIAGWQGSFCGCDEEVGEERFEPGSVVVFVAVDRFFDDSRELRGGTGGAEVNFLIAAVETFERDGDIALKRESAAFAEWRFDQTNSISTSAAGVANIALSKSRPLFATHLADFWIEQSQEMFPEAAHCGKLWKGKVHDAIDLGRGGMVF